MTEEDLNRLADAWIRYWHAPKNSKAQEESVWATEEELDLLFDGKSEELWQIIQKIHERDQSIAFSRFSQQDLLRISFLASANSI